MTGSSASRRSRCKAVSAMRGGDCLFQGHPPPRILFVSARRPVAMPRSRHASARAVAASCPPASLSPFRGQASPRIPAPCTRRVAAVPMSGQRRPTNRSRGRNCRAKVPSNCGQRFPCGARVPSNCHRAPILGARVPSNSRTPGSPGDRALISRATLPSNSLPSARAGLPMTGTGEVEQSKPTGGED
jgi:hypothetical protein